MMKLFVGLVLGLIISIPEIKKLIERSKGYAIKTDKLYYLSINSKG